MKTQTEFDLEKLPEYHVLAAEARRQQSLAMKDAFVSVSRWVRGALASLTEGEAATQARQLGTVR